jgi:hypothetical protein
VLDNSVIAANTDRTDFLYQCEWERVYIIVERTQHVHCVLLEELLTTVERRMTAAAV